MIEAIVKLLGAMVILFIVVVIGAVITGTIVMWLWNMIIPDLFHLPALSWGQAYVLTVLCSILFKSSLASTSKD